MLDVPTPHGTEQVRVLALVDVISSGVSSVAISLPLLQQWYDRPGANFYELQFAAGADAAAVTAAVRRAMPESVHVFTGQEAVAGAIGSIEQMGALFAGVQWIIAFVAAVALLNTLMLSVLERRREVGVLRAIGSSRRTALRMVLAEAAAIGITGATIGAAFGMIAHFLGSRALEPLATIPVEYALTPWMFGYAAGALVLCLLGAVPPARHAARANIVAAVAAD